MKHQLSRFLQRFFKIKSSMQPSSMLRKAKSASISSKLDQATPTRTSKARSSTLLLKLRISLRLRWLVGLAKDFARDPRNRLDKETVLAER
jgi:hypothetical protein